MSKQGLFFSFKHYKALLQALLIPDEIYEKPEDIDMKRLYEQGYRTVFLDVDNCLIPYDKKKVPLQKETWVSTVKGMGFRIFLTSNNSSKRRIARVAEQLELEGVYFATKPFTPAIRDLADTHYIDVKKAIVIGDQLFTDIILANWLRAYAILVSPIDIRKSFLKTLQRKIELWLIGALDKE